MSNYGAPIHIHTGTTCGDSQLVAGHYYASPADPWDTRTLVTDGAGTTTGTIAGVRSGICAASSVGHAIVVHDRSNRIACGVCVPTCTATMAPYPGYAGSVNLAGTVKATATGMDHFRSTIDLDYQLTGAVPSAQGGIRIHTGTTCADASLVSGHYFATASDPWSTTTYQTDGIGAVTGTIAGVAAGLGFNATARKVGYGLSRIIFQSREEIIQDACMDAWRRRSASGAKKLPVPAFVMSKTDATRQVGCSRSRNAHSIVVVYQQGESYENQADKW